MAAEKSEHLLSSDEIAGIVHNFGTFNTEQMRQYYDKWAQSYDKDFVDAEYHGHTHVAAAVKSNLSAEEEPRILDVCAGTGALASMLRSWGFSHIDAVDVSLGMLTTAAEKRLYDCSFQLWLEPGTRTPLASDFYDAVVCAGGFVAGHLKPGVLAELCRICKPGGSVIFGVNSHYALAESGLAELVQKMAADGDWAVVAEDSVPAWLSDQTGTVYVCQKAKQT